ncbi:Lrp/AsnC family transcriptional regulator [Cupriavidus gilardii]|uniref:Lrp/AsnC family transcriptional regulator n=1 Tax=Cupriavidus gilardii TaxID=82541 RepID=A0A6N1BAZ6_9BURK|nr:MULTISPECIES: Lrp/AsnC family transcriptional regulator [Cupriavidus]ALD92826.1 AsnC/Lrp family transcriptional regulator [Cupriavidus gilardii CR3]QQE09600.1 Lrp/AsnC family transcriptional regulator [Cupriavidus sp. ISTL7]ESH88047.1 AsnC family transcriptional regulator [Cupriavidus sp. HPC(L)]KAB0597519.1 Lrp/AsnC family transcriptional regulator [Cupriavidus gilardii]MCD9122434.1 Lrp/AsnC family transcriptional regulator [Cupriavidus sp. UGS-1]
MHSIELDRTDRRLLDVLQEHGRASNLELAEAINLSPAQTLRRHRRLEESGIIKRYEARLDGAMLGFGVVAFIHVTMERGHIRDLSKFKGLVTELAQIQECFSVTGDIDYVLKVVARDLKSLSDFLLDTLMRIPGVSGVRSSVCLDEIKCTSAMPLEL